LDATLLSSSRGQQSADTRIREDPDIKTPSKAFKKLNTSAARCFGTQLRWLPHAKKSLASVTLPKHIDATCPSYGLYSDRRIAAKLDSGSFLIAVSVNRETMAPSWHPPKEWKQRWPLRRHLVRRPSHLPRADIRLRASPLAPPLTIRAPLH
jgi:hypothetical protein